MTVRSPRGNYVRVGGHGVYYQRTLTPPRITIANTPVAMREIESASAAQIVDSSSDELLNEIREKRARWRVTPLVIFICGVLVLVSLTSWLLIPMLVASLGAILAAIRYDTNKSVVVVYDFDPATEQVFTRASSRASGCRRMRRSSDTLGDT